MFVDRRKCQQTQNKVEIEVEVERREISAFLGSRSGGLVVLERRAQSAASGREANTASPTERKLQSESERERERERGW